MSFIRGMIVSENLDIAPLSPPVNSLIRQFLRIFETKPSLVSGSRQQQTTGSSDIIHRLLTFASCCDLLSSVMFPLYRAMVQQGIVVNIIIINCTLHIGFELVKVEGKDFCFWLLDEVIFIFIFIIELT